MTHRDEIINYIFNRFLEKNSIINEPNNETLTTHNKDSIILYMCINKDNYNSLNNFYNNIQYKLDEYIINEYLFHMNEY
jgi:hypothetical protein